MLLKTLTAIVATLWKWLTIMLAFQASITRELPVAETEPTCANDDISTFSGTSHIVATLRSTQQTTAIYPNVDHMNQLETLEIHKVTGVDHMTQPTPAEKKQIKKALITINNSESLETFFKNKVNLNIVSEEYMQEITGLSDFSACYLPSPYNSILLNQHLFDKKRGTEQADQLTTILANELSHASIHNHHPLKSVEPDDANPFQTLVPWKNPSEKKQFVNAYKQFTHNIKNYKTLIEKSSLSKPMNAHEQATLMKFNNAMHDYIPPRFGANGYHAMQTCLAEKDDTIVEMRNLRSTIPSQVVQNERLVYLRDNFFRELESKALQYRLLPQSQIGIYQNDDNQRYADLISDFESLSPDMRQTFGPELCQRLNQYHGTSNHCERPRWQAKT